MSRQFVRNQIRLAAVAACFLGTMLLLSTGARADDFGAEMRDFTVRTWSKADGLPNGSVSVILQTEDGYIWVGTAAGLARFDGLKFTHIALPSGVSASHPAITALCEDARGALWIGTESSGLFRWQDERVEHFGAADGLLDNAVTSLTLDSAGCLWIGTRHGVNRLQGSSFDAFTTREGLPDNSVSSVHAARSGTVWITTAGGMCRYIDGHISRFEFPTTGKERQEGFLGAYEDRRGNLWAFYATYLINLTKGNQRINYFPGEKSAMTRIWSMCEGRSGRLWIGASGRGVFALDGAKFQPVTLNEGHWPNDVRTICEDREGDLWLGISDGVLAQLRPQRFALLTGAHGLPAGGATCLTADSTGRVYIGMDAGGLYASTADRFERVLDDAMNLAQELVASVCASSDSSIWIGTVGNGLYHIKDGHSVNYSTANGLSDDCVLAVCADAEGAVWAGTRAGMLHLFHDSKMSTYSAPEGLPGSAVTAILCRTEGEVWVGTESGALLRGDRLFHGVTVQRLDPRFNGKAILGICESADHAVWFGTAGGGLGCMRGDRCLAWDMRDGLLDNSVSAVVADSENNIWLSLSRGLCRIDSNSVAMAFAGSGALKPKLLFETEPGPDRALSLSGPQAVRSSEGRLWFATAGGMVGIDTHGWEGAVPAPQVHIDSIFINNEKAPFEMNGHAKEIPIKFPARLQSLEIQVAGLSFEAPEKIRFRHKLDNFDADWVDTGPDRRISYGRLPSGNYTFHVTACNGEGVWNESGASLAFVIPTPLWRAPWVLTLAALAAAGAAAGAVRYVTHRRLITQLAGMEQQQAMERERMRIARNMHDEIGSKLTKISFLSERLKVESKPTGPAGDQINSIATTSRDLLKALDEMVWVVNPRNDTLEHLASYLSQYATEYFQDTPIECDVRVQSDFPSLNMSAEYRHNVFLAFEESLSNVLKHARATRVEVHIQVEQGALKVRVSDNGVGFSTDSRNGHTVGVGRNGLTNMKQHLLDVRGACVIQSAPGQGTIVELKMGLASARTEVA